MQLLPIVMGACAEDSLVRGCITVLEPILMGCDPVRDAFSAMTRLEENEVGGLGAGGIVEVRRLEDIASYDDVRVDGICIASRFNSLLLTGSVLTFRYVDATLSNSGLLKILPL